MGARARDPLLGIAPGTGAARRHAGPAARDRSGRLTAAARAADPSGRGRLYPMTHHEDLPLPEAPARLELPRTARLVALGAVLLGGGAFAWSLAQGHASIAWSAYCLSPTT